jgi:muramoyltetrapeptide carboxypeptidase
MLERGADVDGEAFDALVAALTGGPPPAWRGRGVAPGQGEGRLVGGNLVLVAASLGAPWEVDTRGAILLIEEVGEQPYRIDRLLQQLRAAGKLAGLAGIGVGALEGCVDARYPSPSALEVMEEVARALRIPLVAELPFGHVKRNFAWPVGARARIDGGTGELTILERGVVTTS